jgi:electron transport complex protein RnfD
MSDAPTGKPDSGKVEGPAQMLRVTTSPHMTDRDTTARIMWSVVLALAPAFLGALYVFGWYAGLVTLVSVAGCMVAEGVIQRLRGVTVTVSDGSAAVTGVLLAFTLPPDVPLWVPLVGAVVAIGIAKQFFGGLGHNIWNPALVGRAVLQISFPSIMNRSAWPVLRGSQTAFQWSRFLMDIRDQARDVASSTYDAITMASPLSMSSTIGIKEFGYDPAWATPSSHSWQMWLGYRPGCLGETSFILLAVGAIALILLKRVKWQLPLFYIGTVALLTWVFPYNKASFPATEGFFRGDPLYHVAFGGLALGAFFMATDMVTSPLTTLGQMIFGAGCGLITAVIRLFGGYPEGVCYSILIMNTMVPMIDRFTRPRVFGTKGTAKS